MARLFRLAFEHGEAGARYHGAADLVLPFADIAAAVGRRLGLPTVSVSPADAESHLGWLHEFAARGNPTSNAIT